MRNLKKINFNYFRNIPGIEVKQNATDYGNGQIIAWVDLIINHKYLMTCDCYADKSYFADLLNIDSDKCTPEYVKEHLSEIENDIEFEFIFPGEEAAK